MRNNYDLILNFEKVDGEPLSEDNIKDILYQAKLLSTLIEKFSGVKVWKSIISQAVASEKIG